MKQRVIRIDKTQSGIPFSHTHKVCVGAGRANEGLRADWQNQLKECVKDCGFSYLRFHGLLCDDMGVYQIVDGKEWHNFQYIDSLFDAMLEIGIRPFVEFGFMPRDLSSKPAESLFWWNANSAPPKDYDAWARLVKTCVEYWIERYGLDEVLNWYFEIWNEPNLKSFWRGTWICEFLEFAAKKGLPVDFVSTHPYPTDFALAGHNGVHQGRTRKKESLKKDIEWLQKVLANSAYPNAEIHFTEWSSSPMSMYPNKTKAEEIQAMGETITLHLEMTGLKPNTRVMAEILDEDNGTCTTLWKEMGYPTNLRPDQKKELLKFADATKVVYTTADENGNLVWDIEQKPWALVLVKECR